MLSAEDRAFAIKEAGDAFESCPRIYNVLDCGCYGRAVLEARFRHGFEMLVVDTEPVLAAMVENFGVTRAEAERILASNQAGEAGPERKVATVAVVSDVNNGNFGVGACVDPDKVRRHAAGPGFRRYQFIAQSAPQGQEAFVACVGDRTVEFFTEHPALNLFNSLLDRAVRECRLNGR